MGSGRTSNAQVISLGISINKLISATKRVNLALSLRDCHFLRSAFPEIFKIINKHTVARRGVIALYVPPL